MINENGKIWCSFIDWDMYESMKALEDKEFQDFAHSILKLQKTRLPQEFKFYVTTAQQPLSHLLTEEIAEEFISYPDWETFWEEFKNAHNERNEEKKFQKKGD